MKIGETIYFDHQASTPLDSRVFEAMRPHMESEFGNPHASEHIFGWRSMQAIENAANSVAALVGADYSEIIFTSGATESNNLALQGLAKYSSLYGRNRIITSAIEHKCIFEIGRYLQSYFDISLEQIPVDSFGRVDMEIMEKSIGHDVLLVSVMAVNNEVGTIQNIPAISCLAKSHGCLVHCDAAQAPSAMDISKLSDYVDLISLSGHKIYGPMGIGALYIDSNLQKHMVPVIHGAGQQKGLRSGTLPTALCIGLGAAAQLFLEPNAIDERIELSQRRDLFSSHLESLPCNTWLNGPDIASIRHPGNINIGFEGISATDLLNRLQPKLIASTGSACSSGAIEPSHVLRSLGLDKKDASSSIRFSLGRFTKDEDVHFAINCLKSEIEKIIHNNLIDA